MFTASNIHYDIAERTRLTLPAQPSTIEAVEVCATSGLLPANPCPRISDFAKRGHAPIARDTWHDDLGAVHYPERAAGWLKRRRFVSAVAN